MKTGCLILVMTFVAKIAIAQSVSSLMGARTVALGNSSAAATDAWSGQNNPAGLGWLDGAWVAFASERSPGLLGANRTAATAGLGSKPGSLSIGAFRFGDDLYNEQLLNLSLAHRLGLASIGARVDLMQFRCAGLEPVIAAGVTVGTRAQITERVVVGGYANNINRPEFPDGQAIPVRVAAGFTWKTTDQVSVSAELEKISDTEPIIKSGLELTPLKKVKFRTGINLFPYAVYAGIGIKAWNFSIDYAVSFNQMLSYSHQLSIELSRLQQTK